LACGCSAMRIMTCFNPALGMEEVSVTEELKWAHLALDCRV
jgi:hypothetical protein